MAKQQESALSRKIINALNARGHCVFKHHSTAFSVPGVTDIIGCTKQGIAVFLETKMPGKLGTFAPDQKAFCARVVRRSGGMAVCAVVSSVEEAIAAVETVDGESIVLEDGQVIRRGKGQKRESPI